MKVTEIQAFIFNIYKDKVFDNEILLYQGYVDS